MKKRKRGAQPGNRNALKHRFYSPTLSPEKISLVWSTINRNGIDPTVAVIRIKLGLALQRDPTNHRLLEDAAKLLTKRGLTDLYINEFHRRQFRAAILNALELSHHPSPTPVHGSIRAWLRTNRAAGQIDPASLGWQNRTNRAYFNNLFSALCSHYAQKYRFVSRKVTSPAKLIRNGCPYVLFRLPVKAV
jgi:hypothetical protein